MTRQGFSFRSLVGAITLALLVPIPSFAKSAPTFTRDVAPIFQRSCVRCHHDTGIGPMSLVTFEDVRPWARSIKDRVTRRLMPPWHVDPTVGITEFKNDMSLSDVEIDTITRWVDSGASQGNPADMPDPIDWPSAAEWELAATLGEPDLVGRSTPYTVTADGQDQWWNPVIKLEGIPEARWIKASEFKPSYPTVSYTHLTLPTSDLV